MSDKLWCPLCGKWGDHTSGRCPELASERATPMLTGPAKVVVAGANGWVPVSSAEALASEWEDKAKGYMQTAPDAANPSHRERIEAVCDTLWHCARQLRRQMEAETVRQPAPNGRSEP